MVKKRINGNPSGKFQLEGELRLEPNFVIDWAIWTQLWVQIDDIEFGKNGTSNSFLMIILTYLRAPYTIVL